MVTVSRVVNITWNTLKVFISSLRHSSLLRQAASACCSSQTFTITYLSESILKGTQSYLSSSARIALEGFPRLCRYLLPVPCLFAKCSGEMNGVWAVSIYQLAPTIVDLTLLNPASDGTTQIWRDSGPSKYAVECCKLACQWLNKLIPFGIMLGCLTEETGNNRFAKLFQLTFELVMKRVLVECGTRTFILMGAKEVRNRLWSTIRQWTSAATYEMTLWSTRTDTA